MFLRACRAKDVPEGESHTPPARKTSNYRAAQRGGATAGFETVQRRHHFVGRPKESRARLSFTRR
jgi:hypothetical protein